MPLLPATTASSSRKRARSNVANPPQKKAKPATNLPPLGQPIHADFHPSFFKTPTTGYTAATLEVNENAVDPENEKMVAEDSLEDLRDQSWRYIRWDGSKARPLLDRNGRSIGFLAGIPQGDLYQMHCAEAQKLMIRLGETGSFSSEDRDHIRGPFPAFRCGVAHGGGQPKSHNLDVGSSGRAMMEELRNSPSIKALAEMQDAMFQKWIPKLHSFYQTQLSKIFEHLPRLEKNFEGSVWPTAAFNLAGRVCTRRHRDRQNLLYGVCAITSLGQFDHTKGGHLILPDLEMVIEFPAGSIILIPSALLEHANTPVATSETRLSFTQYAAGSHFRYVDYGCQTGKELQESDPALYQQIRSQAEQNHTNGVGWLLHHTLDELRAMSLDSGFENMNL